MVSAGDELPPALRGRDRILFSPDGISVPAVTEEEPGVWVGPLRFVLEFTDRRPSLTVDLTDLPRAALAREITGALAHQARQPGMGGSRGAVVRRTTSIRRFFEFLEDVGDPQGSVKSVKDLKASHLTDFEAWLRLRYPRKSLSPYNYISAIVDLLRHGMKHLRWILDESLIARLGYGADGEKGESTPWDGWSHRVAAQLRRAARRAVGEAIRRRVAAENALRLGQDPRVHGWTDWNNLLWWVDAHGPMTSLEYVPLVGKRFAFEHPLVLLNSALFLTRQEVSAFLILQQLETAIPIEGLRELSTDCLQNPGGTRQHPTIEIHYMKRRAVGHENRHERFRDGGSTTPGGLVRWLLQLTARARRHHPHLNLWVHYATGRGLKHLESNGPILYAAQEWVAEQGILGDDGKPLDFNWMQLRKTAWNMLYKKHGALTPIVTRSHTVAVAGKHYGPIPINEEVHEAAIEHAQADALAVAFRSHVITSAEVERLQSNPAEAARVLNLAEAEIGTFLGDSCDKDVFLAACRNFENSPFGVPGEECPSPFWNCLDCVNALIHPRHLPAILVFLDGILEGRDELSETEWAQTWGRTYHRLVQVLSRFSPGEISEARSKAELHRPLVFLPIEAYPGVSA